MALAGFAGFFGAMALVNVIAGAVMRSAAGAVYAALMFVLFALEIYSIPHGVYGGPAMHACLLASYFTCVVLFAFTLLRTMRYDRVTGWITLAALAMNAVFVFLEDLVPTWQRFYALDQAALDVLVLMLFVVGLRALSERPAIARIYLAGVSGPAVGMVLNDLAGHRVIANSLWMVFSFDIGIAWEAAFFAYALAVSNRGIQSERDRYAQLASVDGLTGVANRRAFDETLERMWNLARRAGVPCALAMIDIDQFKLFNDTHGHQAGDECLRRVAAVCESVMSRSTDCFARYGGEEFAAILFDVRGEQAVTLAERVRRAVEEAAGVTISVGIAARVPQPGDDPLSLVQCADAALYEAKRSGRNQVSCA